MATRNQTAAAREPVLLHHLPSPCLTSSAPRQPQPPTRPEPPSQHQPLPVAAIHPCAVLPAQNEARSIASLLQDLASVLQAHTPFPSLVVDDGSSDATSQLARDAGAHVLTLPRAQGKGNALRLGLEYAATLGSHWALCLDADGQHLPQDAIRFIEAARPSDTLIVGNRMHDPKGMPWIRRSVNRWMSARISALAGVKLHDTQCGYRLLHLPSILNLHIDAPHFLFESETIVRCGHAGLTVREVPIHSVYPTLGQSHIRPLRDTARWLNWYLQHHRSSQKKNRHHPDS